MAQTSPRNAPRKSGIYITSALLLVLAVASGFALYQLSLATGAEALAAVRAAARDGLGAAAQSALQSGVVWWVSVPILGPVLLSILLLIVAPRRVAAPPAVRAAAPTPPAPVEPAPLPPAVEEPQIPGAAGLRLLAALQEEARLVDFVREDLDEYSDEQVGAAVRGIHASLRKAVDERVTLESIVEGEDGDAVEVPARFDPSRIRVTGNPKGDPPYRGVLRHGGWKASEARLPTPTPGSDPTILAPAEVEVGAE